MKKPSKSEHGPPKWYFAKFMYGRYRLLRQGSYLRDLGQNNDTTKAILKNVRVFHATHILYDFRTKRDGFVGCIFRYLNERNYVTFEVGGGTNVKHRWFRIRKVVKGAWSTIKMITTPEQLSFLPFFGYDVNTWYSVKIIVNNSEIDIFIGLLGTTERMKIMSVTEPQLKEGRIGFSTSGTEAVFDEIFVRPPPLPYSKFKPSLHYV